jgi:transposase InsO family protein
MHTMMLSKKSVKEAWEAIKTMRLVADRVKEVNAQKLLAEFESITFKPGEAIDDFVVRIGKIASDLRGLGETSVNDARVVKKFLRAVPSRYNQVAVAIEMFSDLKTLSIEELVGRLRAGEDRFEPSVDHMLEKTGRLLLTARNKSRMVFDSSSSSGAARGGAGHYVKKDKQKGRGAHGGGDAREPKLTSMGTPRRRGKCKKCGIYGHWAKECKTQMKDERQDTALHVGADGEPALMVARVCNLVRTQGSEDKHVFLNQDHVFPTEYDDGAWVLDTGAMNHMTGNRESVHGAVRFGDGSRVKICGIGAVTITGRNKEHRVLTEVYYIPSLKCNIVSLGQLEEWGCRVEIENGVLQVFERRETAQKERGILIRAERRNRLYLLKVNLTTPVCLITKMDEDAWLWHAWYGHLNFRSLRDLGTKKMVDGIPLIQRVEQVCDGCALGKHHCAPFPRATSYRATTGLELVHGDLSGHITPPTPGGKRYFLLMVDDFSRYMWLELLATKDEAFVAFKKVKCAAEMESGRQLKVFRTDRGGEFKSGVFTVYCTEQGIKRNTTAPYTPQQNGVVERRNQSVVEMARCLMKSMQVPAQYWGEAVKVAVYLLNRSPTKSLNGKTPFEAWFGKKPGVQH